LFIIIIVIILFKLTRYIDNTRTSGYNLRKRKLINYNVDHYYNQIFKNNYSLNEPNVINIDENISYNDIVNYNPNVTIEPIQIISNVDIVITAENQNQNQNQNQNATNAWSVYDENYDGPESNKGTYWISATAVKNYLMNDPLLDWLNLYDLDGGKKISRRSYDALCQNILFEQGHKFENKVVEMLKNMYPTSVSEIVHNPETRFDPTEQNETIRLMKEGVPIIIQASLYNHRYKTWGISDIIIRSDFINKLFTEKVLSDEEVHKKAPELNGDYHYRVIDIKWTTMPLKADGNGIRNDGLFHAYKGQLHIYNEALGIIQGYTPSEAYIMGKGYKYEKNGQTYCGDNAFERLGVIKYADSDNFYLAQVKEASIWMRNVRFNGHKWRCDGNMPTRDELYPNMNNRYDAPHQGNKRKIADRIGELTDVYMVGIKHRKIAHGKNIYSWKDARCTSEQMELNGKKSHTVDKILEINRSNIMIYPDKITNNHENWQHETDLDFYTDFETINLCLAGEINVINSKMESQVTFMIGIWYKENQLQKYKSFVINQLTLDEEARIYDEFVDFINTKTYEYNLNNNTSLVPKLFHWSHAEKTSLRKANQRNNNKWLDFTNAVTWIDIRYIFEDEPIVINGALKFALKDVVGAMYKNKMIHSRWDASDPKNGGDAMFTAVRYYEFMFSYKNMSIEEQMINNARYQMWNNNMKQIEHYNSVDCCVMFEILQYLRKEHCHV